MYLKKIVCENMGPISVADITPGFHPNGNPKPLVIVGKNGTGKSILISNIVDSFFEFGNQAYGDVAKKDGISNLYFKVASDNQIQLGKKSMICHLEYKNDDNSTPASFYTYYQDSLKKDSILKAPNDINYFNEKYGEDRVNRNIEKCFTTNKSLFQKDFAQNIYIYFPPERFFIPYWLGSAYSFSPDYGNTKLQNRFSNELNKPIIAYNPTEDNTRWIIDVLSDAKANLKVVSETEVCAFDTIPDLIKYDKSKKSIERVFSRIINQNVLLYLGQRNTGKARLAILSAQDNKVIVPTIDALSTGQMVLLNMFLSIVRYADKDDPSKCVSIQDIKGIVVIDEIELHLHSDLQGSVLPRLIQMFPKVQFIITSHSPLFLLGMQEVFSDDGFDIFEMQNGNKINAESFSEFKKAFSTIAETQTFQNEMSRMMQTIGTNEKALIITEGPSDWKYMKRAWEKLKSNPKYLPIVDKFEFLEYEPSNSSNSERFKIDMGESKLRKTLDFLVEFPNRRKIILIADRDVSETVHKFTENGSFKHHMLGKFDTNVYSFVIPVPSHRNFDNVFIEHYFSDEDIRTPVVIDNLERHIFMGSDFNNNGFGLSPYSDYYCNAPKLCGANSNAIIDGSVRVSLLSQKGDGPNYALSKNDFADAVLKGEGPFANISFDSFSLIFDILLDIIAPGSHESTKLICSTDLTPQTEQQKAP